LKKNLRLFSWLILAITVISCSEGGAFKKHITEGVIVYDVTYPELDSDNLMLEMLPNEMKMTFKDDKFKSQLKTGAGIVEMTVIANGEQKLLHNMIKLFSDRYVLTLDEDDALKFTNVIPPFQINYIDGVDTIAQAVCNRILIDFGAAKNESYIFAFTDEIALKSPNWCTPYHEIEVVLLDYRVENYGMNMRLRATSISSEEVDDSEFIVDERYQSLSVSEFNELVVKNMKIFME
jgi:hypothetical protein